MAQFTLSPAAQIEYDAMVKAEYRSQGFLLRNAVRRKENVVGSSVQFRRMGQIVSTPTGYAQAVTPQNPGIAVPAATLVKHTTPVLIDDVEELTVNFDAKMESVGAIGQAMGRRSDVITLDAIAVTPGKAIAVGTSNMTYDKYTEVFENFEDKAVPIGDRFIAMSANNFRSLLKAEQFTSSLFTNNRVLDKAMIREFLGMNVIIIPTMTEGGLAYNTGTKVRTALAWHKQAVGFGVGANFRTEINYAPTLTSWLANGVFSAGAIVIDNRGTISIDCDENL